MKVGRAGPKYERIVAQRLRQDFPLASARGREMLWRLMDHIRPAIQAIDLQQANLTELGRVDLKLMQGKGADPAKVLDRVLALFGELPNWAHPLTQKNLMPPTTAVSVVTAFLTALFNPDICSTEFSGQRLAAAEQQVVTLLSELVGYDPRRAFGFFTYGGTLAIQYGIMLALEKSSPGRYLAGQREENVRILCSNAAHFSVKSAAGATGLGAANVIKIATDRNDEMVLADLEARGNEVLSGGGKIAAVVATLGTTDTAGLDDLRGIDAVRRRWARRFALERPVPLHADAAVGWAWSFFGDYDFAANPLQFPAATLAALRRINGRISGLPLADTISLNPHKYGYVPIPAGFILFRENGPVLAPLKRQSVDMPPLYNLGERHPGSFTIETTRYAGGVIATLANLMLLGREGYQAILGRVVEMGLYFRRRLAQLDNVTIINQAGSGGGTTFFFSRPGATVLEDNALNERILERLQSAGPAAVNLSSTYTREGRIVLKSLVISPAVSRGDIDRIAAAVAGAARLAGG